MRSLYPLLALLLAACAPAPPPPAAAPKVDPTAEAAYGQAVEQLTAMVRQAESLVAGGKPDDASAMITKAQPLEDRVLAPPRPTLAAMEAASDLDQLYGRMLLGNKRYGWARLMFQKNVTRWKYWKPATSDTERRLKLALSAIAECDRGLQQ